jgi:methylphosphotriester-DNA--protein-cysteine methyltransferase
MTEEVKDLGGRPLLFESAEELQKKINEYYEWSEKKEKPMTLERLAVFLDCSVWTLRNYQKKEKFFPAIEKARSVVLADKVERLNEGKATAGIIFDLCNNNKDLYTNKERDGNDKIINVYTNSPVK